MMYNVICYRTKEDVVYNKGTEYESRCNTFLYQYTSMDMDYAQTQVRKLNQMLKDGVGHFDGLDLNRIDFFYLDEQEMMY